MGLGVLEKLWSVSTRGGYSTASDSYSHDVVSDNHTLLPGQNIEGAHFECCLLFWNRQSIRFLLIRTA
jgi:hypothetical protein